MRRVLAALLIAVASVMGQTHFAMADTCKGHSGNAPECEIPESPYALGLPATGLAVLGGFVYLKRRRQVTPPDDQ